jgi:hypothetical protein
VGENDRHFRDVQLQKKRKRERATDRKRVREGERERNIMIELVSTARRF